MVSAEVSKSPRTGPVSLSGSATSRVGIILMNRQEEV